MKYFFLFSLMLFSNLFVDPSYFNSTVYNAGHVSQIKETIIFESFGLKQVYADILYIRLLQYYGAKRHIDGDYLYGDYPLMYTKAKDIVFVDPTYTNSVIMASTILAFGLKETFKSKSILKTALDYDKDNEKYNLLLAAIISYEKNKMNIIDVQTIEMLYKIADDKKSSAMFKNIVAFLCKRAGRKDLAIKLYRKLADDPNYREIALRQIKMIESL